MKLSKFFINNIVNKNIYVLGRHSSGKTLLIKHIIEQPYFNDIYLLNVKSLDKLDNELNLPNYTVDDFDNIYNTINCTSQSNTLLIIENFNLLQKNMCNVKLKKLMENNQSLNLTIIFVANYFNGHPDYTYFFDYVDLTLMSSSFINVNELINLTLFPSLNEHEFEDVIETYIDGETFLVSDKKEVYYYKII